MYIRCNGMCLSYRTTSYSRGLQLWEVKEFDFCLYHAVWVLNMLNHILSVDTSVTGENESKIIYSHIFEARCMVNKVIHRIDTM